MGVRVIGERANRNGRTVQLKPHRTIMGERTRHERGRVNTRIPALLIYAARLYLYPAISACRDTRERERERAFLPFDEKRGREKMGMEKNPFLIRSVRVRSSSFARRCTILRVADRNFEGFSRRGFEGGGRG